MINLVLIGSGRWGQKYISTLASFNDVNLKVANRNNWKEFIDEIPDGVIVCTPPSSHIEIASYSLKKNIATMIEKPLALSLNEAIELSEYDDKKILINHIHLFSIEYQELKYKVSNNKINNIISNGYGCGPTRDYSSLWDYGVHDISMILDLTNQIPHDIKIIKYENNFGTLFKVQMIFDNFNTYSLIGNGGENSLRDICVNFAGINAIYNDKVHKSNYTPPLTNALTIFINCIHGKSDSRLGLNLSLNVIKVLEFCQEKLNM